MLSSFTRTFGRTLSPFTLVSSFDRATLAPVVAVPAAATRPQESNRR